MKILLPFLIPKLVKSLPFYVPEAWKRYPFRAETPRIGHCSEYPPPRAILHVSGAIEGIESWGNGDASLKGI